MTCTSCVHILKGKSCLEQREGGRCADLDIPEVVHMAWEVETRAEAVGHGVSATSGSGQQPFTKKRSLLVLHVTNSCHTAWCGTTRLSAAAFTSRFVTATYHCGPACVSTGPSLHNVFRDYR